MHVVLYLFNSIQINKAIKLYEKAKSKDHEVLAGLKDAAGKYNDAIRLLLKHNLIVPALRYAKKYETEGIPISKCYDVHTLAIKYAEELSKSDKLRSGDEEHLKQFKAVLEYLPPTDQVSYFKSAEMHEKACEILLSEGKYAELYRIYKAQEWHEEGIRLAQGQKNREVEEAFVLFKATTEMEGDSGELSDTTITMLKKKRGINTEREVRASLIYGMGTQNYTMIMTTSRFFKSKRNPIAYIEAFGTALSHAKYDEATQTWTNINLKPNEDLFDLLLAAYKEVTRIKTLLSGANDEHSFSYEPADKPN